MAKTSGSGRASGERLPNTPGAEAEVDSGQAGEGGTAIWVNERGETCIGNKCFSIAYREDEEDITIRIDRNECGADILPVVELISQALGKGGRTMWETTSLRKGKKNELERTPGEAAVSQVIQGQVARAD